MQKKGNEKKISSTVQTAVTAMRGPILKLLSDYEDVTIDVCDGTRVLPDAEYLFPAGITVFVEDGVVVSEPSVPTSEVEVGVYEQREDTSFEEIMYFLATNQNELGFTWHQIENFAKKHPEWIRPKGYDTLFPLNIKGRLFIARVGFDSQKYLFVVIRHANILKVFRASDKHHFILKKQIKKESNV